MQETLPMSLLVFLENMYVLMKKGYDKVYGARPLARTIDEQIKKALVDELLFGRLVDGGRVYVSLKDEALHFEFQD